MFVFAMFAGLFLLAGYQSWQQGERVCAVWGVVVALLMINMMMPWMRHKPGQTPHNLLD